MSTHASAQILPNIEDLIPHRRPMLLLNAMTEITDERMVAEIVVDESCLFLRQDNTVEPAGCIEMLAQCFAGGSGLRYKSKWGYLAAMKKMVIHGTAKKGDVLTAEVRPVAQLGGIVVVEGTLCRGDELLTSGQFKIYIPEFENVDAVTNTASNTEKTDTENGANHEAQSHV